MKVAAWQSPPALGREASTLEPPAGTLRLLFAYHELLEPL